MNEWTAGLRVRFFKNTISAEIRGPRVLAAKPQGGLMRRLMPQRTPGEFRNGLQQLS